MAIRQDIHIDQGETWSFTYTHASGGSPVDLTGYTARMAVRDVIGGAIYAYLSTGADADGGTITLGGALGTVTLSMTAAETTSLDDLPEILQPLVPQKGRVRKLIYDVEIVSGAGTVTRILEGQVVLNREVTE